MGPQMTRALSVSLCVLSSPRNVVKFFLKKHSHFFKIQPEQLSLRMICCCQPIFCARLLRVLYPFTLFGEINAIQAIYGEFALLLPTNLPKREGQKLNHLGCIYLIIVYFHKILRKILIKEEKIFCENTGYMYMLLQKVFQPILLLA